MVISNKLEDEHNYFCGDSYIHPISMRPEVSPQDVQPVDRKRVLTCQFLLVLHFIPIGEENRGQISEVIREPVQQGNEYDGKRKAVS